MISKILSVNAKRSTSDSNSSGGTRSVPTTEAGVPSAAAQAEGASASGGGGGPSGVRGEGCVGGGVTGACTTANAMGAMGHGGCGTAVFFSLYLMGPSLGPRVALRALK